MRNVFALVIAIILSSPATYASFEENARRYLTAQEIISSLSNFFFIQSVYNCQALSDQNASPLGLASPRTGDPVSPTPNQATVQWISTCIQSSFTSIAGWPRPIFTNLVGEDILKILNADPSGLYGALTKAWASWPVEQKKVLIKYMVSAFLGPDDVIRDFGFIKDPEAFRALLLQAADKQKDADLTKVLLFLSVNLALRDEFLSY